TKNQFARDYIMQRESNQQKALQLGHAVVIHHDIRTADGEFDIFQNITAGDVQRVAQTYFRPENRLVLTILPSHGSTSGGRMCVACGGSVRLMADRRSAAWARGSRCSVPTLRNQDARQRVAGRRGPSSRAADGQHANDRSRWRGARPAGQGWIGGPGGFAA